MKVVKTAIVKVELEYPFPGRYTDKQIKEIMENMELPEEYRENRDIWTWIHLWRSSSGMRGCGKSFGVIRKIKDC